MAICRVQFRECFLTHSDLIYLGELDIFSGLKFSQPLAYLHFLISLDLYVCVSMYVDFSLIEEKGTIGASLVNLSCSPRGALIKRQKNIELPIARNSVQNLSRYSTLLVTQITQRVTSHCVLMTLCSFSYFMLHICYKRSNLIDTYYMQCCDRLCIIILNNVQYLDYFILVKHVYREQMSFCRKLIRYIYLAIYICRN